MKIIGLTGNSGCGKSAIAQIMAKYGALVLDCDAIAHQNMARGGCAYDEIVKTFGTEILDDNTEINRKALGQIVFSDKSKLAQLNSITHSKIAEACLSEIEKNRAKYSCIVIDAPLLLEAGLDKITDRVWVVTADLEIRLARIEARDSITEKEALMRFSHETPRELLLSRADLVIEHNENDFEKLEKKVYSYMKNEELLNV